MNPISPSRSQSSSASDLLFVLYSHLSIRRRIQLVLLLVVMLTSGLAELMALGAVFPFLAVLTDPQPMWQQPLVQDLATKAGFASASQLLIPVTLAFALAAVLAAVIRVSNLWLSGKLAASVGSDLSCEAYRRTLYQPYSVHAQVNSAEVISRVITQITLTVASLNALLQVIASVVVVVSLLVGLLMIDAQVAFGTIVLFGTVYGALAITTQRELRCNGEKIVEASNQQIKALQEGLGAIRDVILDGSQLTYLEIYRQSDRPQRQLQAKNNFLAAYPRYTIEALGMVAISLLGGGLVMQRGSGAAVIPLLGALALGAQRLLPACQQIYIGWATMNGCSAALQAVLEMLAQPVLTQATKLGPLPLRESIRLEGVHFRYSPEQPEVLQGLDLEIHRGERIGLIGTTGSGKSTLVDLLMGLLEPTVGMLLVDGANIHDANHPERLAAWRSAIAHVPQSIYLADGSIAENIAFGVPRQQIDWDRVRQAASQAQIASFIDSCSYGYNTFVGERGIRLSGGQRQRIGIARALYKRARVLVFDEATSALDSGTEDTVMEAINSLSDSPTVIIVAHRLSTLQNCCRVIRLSKGIVSADGTPKQVLSVKSR